jgi:dihydroflavonol-4-reductase
MILVTGATGFLGHHLVAHLAASGFQVRALVRAHSQTDFLRSLAELAVGDVRDRESVDEAVKGCRYVVHAAALFRFWGEERDFEQTNVVGTANVLEAARRHDVEKFIHISTIAVVGLPPAEGCIDEDTPCYPQDAYQRSKLNGETMVRMFCRGAQLPAVILRPGAFYGPWGRYAFNRLFFEDPLKGIRIQVHGGRRLNFPVFVPDVAHAIVTALQQGRVGQTYNLCGEPISHRQANTTISRIAGISPFRLNIPEAVMLAVARTMTRMAERRTHREPYYPITLAPYVFKDWRVSSAKARAELGFAPTPFEEGARQTLEWYWESGFFRSSQHASAPKTVKPAMVTRER